MSSITQIECKNIYVLHIVHWEQHRKQQWWWWTKFFYFFGFFFIFWIKNNTNNKTNFYILDNVTFSITSVWYLLRLRLQHIAIKSTRHNEGYNFLLSVSLSLSLVYVQMPCVLFFFSSIFRSLVRLDVLLLFWFGVFSMILLPSFSSISVFRSASSRIVSHLWVVTL